MKDLARLLMMPAQSEKRSEAWLRITQGATLFDTLRMCVHNGLLDQAVHWASQWQTFVAYRDDHVKHQGEIFAALITCARIATLATEDATRLPILLRELDSWIQIPSDLVPQDASHDPQSWQRFLHHSLGRMTWPAPMSDEWAWDTVTSLMGSPRPVARSVTIGVLLIANTGVIAQLTLERFLDNGRGALYCAPRTMSFLDFGREFQQAMENAVAYTRNAGLWNESMHTDVRWALTRQDGKHLTEIEGGSAGGAFALGLVKLFSEL